MPIFTIPLLTSRAYIITDPDLALATQRSAKTISFTPFVGQFAKMFFNSEPRQTDLILKDLVGPNAEKGMVNVVTKAMHHTLAPGSELDEMNQKSTLALILGS